MVNKDYNKTGDNILGKLRANFMGTEFQLYDSGRSPKDTKMEHNDNDFGSNGGNTKARNLRSELGVILYARNVLGSKGPRKMQVCLNKINENEEGKKSSNLWQPAHKDEEMLTCFKHRIQPAVSRLYILQNKKPQWSDQIGAYVLNFNGRVTMASVKNFQLTEENKNDEIILQVRI